MKLANVVPWGRNLQEYKKMFLLSQKDLQSKKILGCGDGPSSFNFEVTQLQGNITSIDPIYQFTKDDIQTRIDETSSVVSEQLRKNQNDFIWKNIKSVDELINIRLTAMSNFINDYENGKNEKRYIHQELPKLSFEDDSFDVVLSSHFLFLYSEHFDLQFHIDSILEMCRVSKDEVKIFPLLNLKNKKSEYLEPIAFTSIHPFFDGNGLLARLISNLFMLKNGYLPIIVSNENRYEYIHLLSSYNLHSPKLNTTTKTLIEENTHYNKLYDFFTKEYNNSLKILEELQEK